MIPFSAKDVDTAYCAVLNVILSEAMTVEVKLSMKTVRVFSVALMAIFLAVSLLFETGATSTGDAVLVDVAPKVSQEEIDRQREAAAKRSEEESRIREQYLGSEEDIQYYAYLNLSTAAEELKPIVLAARNMFVYTDLSNQESGPMLYELNTHAEFAHYTVGAALDGVSFPFGLSISFTGGPTIMGEKTLAQHLDSSGKLNTSTGTRTENSKFSNAYLYTPSTYSSWGTARTTTAYKQAPKSSQLATVVVNAYTKWNSEDISIRFTQ